MNNVRSIFEKRNPNLIPVNGAIDRESAPTPASIPFETLYEEDFTPELWRTAAIFVAKHPERSNDVADYLIDAEEMLRLSDIHMAEESLGDSLEELLELNKHLPSIEKHALNAPNVTVLGESAVSAAATGSSSSDAVILPFRRKAKSE